MTEKELSTLVINKIDSTETFEAMKAANQINEDELYFIGGDGDAVTGVKGDVETSYRTGRVNITKANIGLGDVDNTADTAKPISTAQQTALDKKVDKVTGKGLSTNDYTATEKQNVANNTAARHSHSNKDILDKITGIVTSENVTNPTNASDLVDYSGFQAGSRLIIDQIPTKTSDLTNDSGFLTEHQSLDGFATETYVNTKVSDLVNSAPETLDTLNELATALGNDPNFATTMATELGKKVDKVMGKGLSTNDLTTALKANYDAAYTHSQSAHAPSNAERNTIVGIQKNGTDVTIDSSTRKANIVVPTKTSELTNDSGYLTEHQNLDNYALKSDLDDKVDKVTGKSLSTNDYTTAEKDKLAKIAENANAYTLPKAGSVLGGVQTGGDVSITDGIISYKSTMPIAKGGTGATTASEACENLNALSKSGGTMTGPLGLTADVHYGTIEPSAPIEGQVFFKQINIAELVYPIGAIYMSTVETSPQTLFGFGTWERIQDTFLLAAGTTYEAGSTGGEATVTLTENEMPTHTHKIWYPNAGGEASAALGYPSTGSKNTYYAEASKVSSTGGGAAHNNMPPYLAVYCWKRTA